MELSLRPSAQNAFELKGILIKGSDVTHWLSEIQRMNLVLESVIVYPVPGVVANSIYGCLVVPFKMPVDLDPGKNEWCQQVFPCFFIAEKSNFYPSMRMEELIDLFGGTMWFMHPEIGLAELVEDLDVRQLIRVPEGNAHTILKPQAGTFIPSEIKSFRIAPVSVEDTLQQLEEEHFPKQKKLEQKPLNLFEKMKLSFYRYHFRKSTSEGKSEPGESKSISTEYLKEAKSGWLNKLMNRFSGKAGRRSERMLRDFENLEERNQQKIDQLLEMLRKNPGEALKYAIPLDENGSARGTNNGLLQLDKRRSGFSLFGSEPVSRSSNGGSVDIGDHYYTLQEQYRATAKQLIDEKEFLKAAFVYIKLLKDNRLAAVTLEKGHLYQDAASVYLKHLNDKYAAAACYEKGNLIENAIDLYKELDNYEKTGDMYLLLNRKKEADNYFEQAAGKLKENNQYIRASEIYFEKMTFPSKARETLLEGWREGKEAENCLKRYLTSFEDQEDLRSELHWVYEREVPLEKSELFLEVLKHPKLKTTELEEIMREMAYEIVSKRVATNPEIVKELRAFNPNNKGLLKDTIRFSIGKTRERRGKS